VVTTREGLVVGSGGPSGAKRGVRIGIVVLSVKTGGPERRLAKLVQYLADQRRHSYYLVAPERLLRSLTQQGILSGTGLELHSVGPDPGGEHLERLRGTYYTAFLAWRRLLTSALGAAESTGATDVVHYLTPVSYFMAPPPFRRHAVIEAVSSGESWRLELMLRQAAERGAVVNCLSRSIQHSLARGMAPDMVRRLHVSPGSMVGSPDGPSLPKQRRVVFLGRLEGLKNPLLFVEAMGLVAKKRRDFRVSIFAEGPLRHAVDSRVRALGLAELVDWNEDQPPAQLLAQSLVAVTLQGTDNYPTQSLLEAMTCRTAIVASDVGQTHRLVNPDTGLLVPLEATAVAAAIDALLADPDRATRMGEAARELVRSEHRVETYAEYVERLYRAVA
jgi:glycosyltransferase involved in cell wall biosynthesis